MKIDRLETHDRLLYFKQDQSDNISKGLNDCLKKNPDSLRLQEKSPYIYIFAHPRTAEDGISKRMLWQPRLTKPPAQTNSYLFRAQSNTDIVEICWMIPPREMWNQYKKGQITENEIVWWSITQFKRNREQLEAPEKDDLNDDQIANIYRDIALDNKQKKMMDTLWMPNTI